MHFNSSQSRSAWTEQEDDLLRNAVGIYGERSWANVAQMVPGRSSKSCSDRWRNFLSPDIEHPRKSPFTEWEIAVVVLAQARYGNNWKAISMLLPGRTNRAVKNLFVGNLKWGARLPEIRNRFLEWGMTLESLLEIKPDRAGGPVKPRPGQVLPDGTNGTSQDDSPLSGSPASTSSAGSAWQSDMTEHPNGSPGSANTSERRRRAEGEMAAQAGQQSSPVPKRRRGAQSPVLGGLQHHLQSPSLAPHPGALGPSFTGVSGTGSPSLGLNIPGTMGPPANRNPNQFVSMDPSNSLMMTKQPVNSSNGSNDGTSALVMPPGSEATPTSDLTASENCASLTPGGALTASLAGGCFGAGGAVLGIMQNPGGPRTNSMPCGGLQQLLMGGDGGMASRVASWHYSGQMFAAAGGAILDPATAAAMAAARPASPFQQHAAQAQVSAVTAAGIPGSLTSLLTDGSDTGAAAGTIGASGSSQVKTECQASAAASYQMQQQHQQHQQWLHQQHYHQQQQHMQHHQLHHHQQQQQLAGMTQMQELPAVQQADPSAMGMHPQQHQQQQQQQLQTGMQHGQDASTASIVASAAMELTLPGSPILAGNILQDMRSNDSAGLHSMLDQILNEDLNMADSGLGGLLGGSDGLPIAPQRSSAFDPPVITLPTPPEAPQACQAGAAPSPSPRPQAPPPTPQGGVGSVGMPMGLFTGQAGNSSSSSGQHAAQAAGAAVQPWGAEYLTNMQAVGMQGGQCAHNSSGAGAAAARSVTPGPGPVAVKSEPAMQVNAQVQQMHRAGSMGNPAAAQGVSQQQQQQVQQQQQAASGPQGLPSRPGSSAGMVVQAGAMHAQSPEPPVLSPDMSMLCAQLQQENMLLMHKLHQMETQMGGKPAAAAAAAAASGPAGQPAEQSMAQHAAAATMPGQMQAQQGTQADASAPAAAAAQHAPAPSASNAWSGFDALMPQLRPVLTRVGGSAGGVLSAGGSMGGLCPADLAAESPAQLINTAFLDDHGLLGGL